MTKLNAGLSAMHERVNATPEEREAMKAKKQADELENALRAEQSPALEMLKNMPIPKNSYWDDAMAAYRTIYEGVVNSNRLLHGQVRDVMDDPEKRKLVRDLPEINALIRMVTGDVATLLNQINLLFERHKSKAGPAIDDTEIVEVLDINAHYVEAMQLYHNNVVPNTAKIIELLGQPSDITQPAIAKLGENATAMETSVVDHATRLDVVTDVIPREISNNKT